MTSLMTRPALKSAPESKTYSYAERQMFGVPDTHDRCTGEPTWQTFKRVDSRIERVFEGRTTPSAAALRVARQCAEGLHFREQGDDAGFQPREAYLGQSDAGCMVATVQFLERFGWAKSTDGTEGLAMVSPSAKYRAVFLRHSPKRLRMYFELNEK